MKSIIEKFAEIKILFFDLDGVLINNSDSGNEKDYCPSFDDFCERIEEFGLSVVVITGREEDHIVKRLMLRPNCEVRFSSVNKVKAAGEILLEKNLNFNEAFFIGDNILDIPLMQRVELKCCPSNARREVKRIVDFVCGSNVCREILEEIFANIRLSRKKNN